MEWSWGRGLAHTDPTRFNKKIICENLWLKKHQFNPLKPNLHLFKNIKIGVNGFQIGLNRCLFQHLPYPAAAFR